MEPFHELDARARAARAVTSEAIAKQEIEVEILANILDSARDKIYLGMDTTGSYLHDQLIMFYGLELAENPEIVANYERVASEIEGKVGEPVVLIDKWDQPDEAYPNESLLTRRETRIRMGIISSDQLTFPETYDFCLIPTHQVRQIETGGFGCGVIYVRKFDGIGGISLKRRPNFLQGRDNRTNLDVGRDKPQKSTFPQWWFNPLTLLIGHEQINQWLAGKTIKNDGDVELILKLAEHLPESGIAPTEVQKQEMLKNSGTYTLSTMA